MLTLRCRCAAPCNFANALAVTPVQDSPSTVVVSFANRAGFFNYADNLVRKSASVSQTWCRPSRHGSLRKACRCSCYLLPLCIHNTVRRG